MPVEPPAELVIVGRFGTPHGVAGAIRLTSFTHPRENIADYQPWWVVTGSGPRQLRLESLRIQGRGFVASVGGVTNRDQAQTLTGLDIAVPRGALPEPEDAAEHYWRDLIGLEVINDDGRVLGRVRTLLDTGAGDVLVVDSGAGETLIPFLAAFVSSVDPASGVIRVSWQDPV